MSYIIIIPLILAFIVSAGDQIVALSMSFDLEGDAFPYPELVI